MDNRLSIIPILITSIVLGFSLSTIISLLYSTPIYILCITASLISITLTILYIVLSDKKFIVIHTILSISTPFSLSRLFRDMYLLILFATIYYVLSIVVILYIKNTYFREFMVKQMIVKKVVGEYRGREGLVKYSIFLLIISSIVMSLYFVGLVYRTLCIVDEALSPLYLKPRTYYITLTPLAIVFIIGFYRLLTSIQSYVEELVTIKTLSRDRSVKDSIREYVREVRRSRKPTMYPGFTEFRVLKVLFILFSIVFSVLLNTMATCNIIEKYFTDSLMLGRAYFIVYTIVNLFISLPLIHGIILFIHRVFIYRRGVRELVHPFISIVVGLIIWYIITYVI